MDLTLVKTIKNLLNAYSIRPSKRLGQNFLVDAGAVKKILKETMRGFNNVEIILGDIRYLGCHPDIKVVGNLPFYLTAPVIRQFLELADNGCPQMTLVAQKEVAQRICAKPPDMNLLAVSVQVYAEPKIISYVSKSSFWPSPEVDAAILRIFGMSETERQHPMLTKKHRVFHRFLTSSKSVSGSDKSLFFKIVKAGFSQPRKQLINNLSKGLKIDKKKVGEWLIENNIQPSQRAETLSVQNWIQLTENSRFND